MRRKVILKELVKNCEKNRIIGFSESVIVDKRIFYITVHINNSSEELTEELNGITNRQKEIQKILKKATAPNCG